MGGAPGFTWDDLKDELNSRKHGIYLRFGMLVFQDRSWLEVPAKTMHGELRFMAVGKIGPHVLSCIFTIEGADRRLLSLRAASRRERRIYDAQIHD